MRFLEDKPMKRYLLWSAAAILIGSVSAVVINNQFKTSKDILNGLSGRRVAATELQQWLNNRGESISEINKKVFYMQESIGSEGVSLTLPQKFRTDFIVKFDLMSLTQSGIVKFIVVNSANGENYSFEMRQMPDEVYRLRVHNNGKLIAESSGGIWKPDVFYTLSFEKYANRMALNWQDTTIWQQEFPEGTGKKALFNILLSGLPDHPAAVNIKNMRIYTAK